MLDAAYLLAAKRVGGSQADIVGMMIGVAVLLDMSIHLAGPIICLIRAVYGFRCNMLVEGIVGYQREL